MKSRVLATVICLLMVITFTACSIADDSFESAMDIITDGLSEPEEADVVEVEVEEEEPTVDEKEPDVKPPTPPINPPALGPKWPDNVPAVTKFNKEFDFVEADGVFTARYTLTISQLQIWTAALTTAGYLGEPRIKDGLVVEVIEKETGSFDNDTGEKLLDVTINIYEAIRNWPEEFSAFPKFEGKGVVTLFEIYNDADGSRVLHIMLQNEEKASVEAYLKKMLEAGFENRGEGVYGKEVDGRTHSFNSDPDKIWKGTTADLFWVIHPAQ